MKILFHAYNTCCQTESGGVQVRIRKIKRLLENKGFQVDFFNPYTTRLIDYDILHLFMLKEETASLVETARTLGLKIVLSSIVTVYPYNYRHLIKKTLQPFMNYLGFFSRYQNERAILRDVDHIIAETPQEMRYIYSRYDINQSKISVIPNGVDAFVESGNEIYKLLHKKCDYVLQVGRIDKNKNLLNVIRAVKGHQLELVVIGGKYAYGDDGYYEECVKESASCNNIHFLGWLASDSKELASAYKNAKVVIVPSFHETFGLTASEAAMAGCKVCLSNTLPILEFGVFDSDLTFNPNNVDEIRTVIEKAMLAHNDNNVQRKAMNIFSWEKIVNNHIEIYNKLNNEK